MKKILLSLAFFTCIISISFFSSCSGCVKKASKKITETGLEVVEGISEAVDEHGDRVGEKATDAAGKIVEGMGRSLSRQLNEHAKEVASVTGRTLVQSIEGLDKGVSTEYYDEIPYSHDFSSGISLDLFGKIKSKAVIDAYFIIMENGSYDCSVDFLGDNNEVILTKNTEINKTVSDRKYTLVSFALNPDEEIKYNQRRGTKVSVKKK